MKGKETIIDRPPRIQPELPSDEIEIPEPPDKQETGYSRLIQVSLPLITIIGYILVSTLGRGGRSIWLLIPMGLSVVASVSYSLYSYFKEKRRRAEIERAYDDRLVELNKEMHTHHDMQRRFYQYNYPNGSTTLQIVHTAREETERKERSLRSESRLWERRVSDEDFGVVRLGMGTLPSTVVYVLKNIDNFEDPQARAAMKLETDARYVSDIPVIISFRPPPEDDQKEPDQEEEEETAQEESARIPFTHALGIAGERGPVYEFVRALLAHYTVFHAPMDARLFILANEKQAWEWTEYLPHSQDDEQCHFRCFVSEAKGRKEESPFDDSEGGELEQFLEGIRKILSQRKIRLQEREQNEGQGDPTRPLLLVVIDLLDTIYDPTSPLHTLEADAAISILLEEGAMLGAAVIFLVPERSKVPGGCRSVVEIESTTPATNSKIEQHQRLHFRYAQVGVNTPRYVGAADGIANPEALHRMAQELALLKIRQSFGASLATSVSFLELMGYSSLEDLKNDTWKHWQESIHPIHSNWLRVKLGKMSGNKPRSLVFSAKRDGVHGMVAGSTGSGKSELLISLIVGMAVTYDPSVLNFVLVDFKGGGAFQEFKDLPHCVDIITNLAGDGVTRMFTAIQSEMNRRQKLNVDTGTKNIVEYRRGGLHHRHHPYPYLFIIIDEFAEMIADRSEFKGQLETITRLGRAQGVSLILAAQRPSGVTDQMRANIKFRICLRVETAGESREMLRRSDASYLPTGIPGRGYLQVGNEDIELIQVAYTGEKYADPNQTPTAKVIWPDRRGGYDAAQDREPPELYKAIIDMLNTMARDQGIAKQHAPWPDFLPPSISLSENLVSQDPTAKAITSDKYLVDVDKIMLGQEREATISLNLSISRWLTGLNGWVEPLDWKKYAMQPVVGLIDNPYAAKQLPLIVDLPRGHAVIFGSSGWGKTTFIRTLVVSLAATHSPDTFHAYILDLGGRNLGVLEKLPHVGALIIPDEEGYKERVEQLLRVLDEIIQQRKTLLNNAGLSDIYQYNHAHPTSVQPAILIAIDNFLEFVETFGSTSDDVESVLDKLIALARQSRPYGIHVVISASQLGNLSNQVYSLFTERLTLKLADPTEYRAIVGGQVPDIGEIPGRGYTKRGRQPLSFQVALPDRKSVV
jgi:DNA segregation ATPase FtsK/SpoIIIE, S-DNA-T family